MAGKQVCCFLSNSNKFLKTKLPISCVITRSNASWEPKDAVTHTGQKFDPEDRRLVRFVDRPKEDKPGNHACGYCGLRFYKEDHHH
ncbi:Protein of unknown function [Cotesia congregata]|uniref:Uncharacterized protein n=1 Tax=Cotesia congregata TaxID=51543 RepID=A0A8J2GZN6_COTCN|nr:Protein of unknown function [Cotesia congregata]